MSKLSVGDSVIAVRGVPGTMEPERKYVGRLGVVRGYGDVVAGEQSYLVRFGSGDDVIDECNLEKVNRL